MVYGNGRNKKGQADMDLYACLSCCPLRDRRDVPFYDCIFLRSVSDGMRFLGTVRSSAAGRVKHDFGYGNIEIWNHTDFGHCRDQPDFFRAATKESTVSSRNIRWCNDAGRRTVGTGD